MNNIEPIKYTEKSIIKLLFSYYRTSQYRLSNSYIFDSKWESDFFIKRHNGYCNEFEVKISRADFFNDAKKVDKHLKLSTDNKSLKPNKFYYVVPEDLIKVEEIPPYAGLIYINHGSVIIVKEPKFIHKDKLNLDKILAQKFYYKWIGERQKIFDILRDYDRLRNFIKNSSMVNEEKTMFIKSELERHKISDYIEI